MTKINILYIAHEDKVTVTNYAEFANWDLGDYDVTIDEIGEPLEDFLDRLDTV